MYFGLKKTLLLGLIFAYFRLCRVMLGLIIFSYRLIAIYFFQNPDLPPYRVEIEAILGPVRLVDPHNDYLALETGCVTSTDIIETDLPNVVELYDFPSEYKTDHLVRFY